MKLTVIWMFLFMYSLLYLLHFVYSRDARTFDMIGKIKAGFQMASNIFSMDRAKGVADLVSQAFTKKHRKIKDEYNSRENVFSGFLRVLGFDSQKISALAVNAMVFVAQMISSTLHLKSPSQISRAKKLEGSPFEWLLDNKHIANILNYTQDKDLPYHIIEHIKETSLDENTACVQLLICKTAPFVWGMQRALKDKIEGFKGIKEIRKYFPSVEEIARHGDSCEKQHPFCPMNMPNIPN